jgi:two-component system, sensor histidine kinase LadS
MRLFTLLFCLFCTGLTAQSPFVYAEKESLLRLEKGATYFVDSSKTRDFETVRQLPITAFKVNKEEAFNLGNIEYPVWLRFDFDNRTGEDLYFMFDRNELKSIDAYLVSEKDTIKKTWQTGVLRPFGKAFFKTTFQTFDLGKQPKSLYLRIETPSLYVLMQLGSIQPIVNHLYNFILFYYAVVGILLALSFYNLFLFFIVKDRLYLYYFFYALSNTYIVLKVAGFSHQFFWYNYPAMNDDINMTNTIGCAFSVLFLIRFLDTKRLAPVLHKTILGLLGLCFLLALFDFMPYQSWINDVYQVLLLGLMTLQFVTSVYIWWSGLTIARFYVIAWAFGNLGVIVAMLGILGVLSFRHFIVFFGFQIGLVLEALFMAFAVADRINIFKKEARDANVLALQRAYENEALMAQQAQLIEEKLQLEQQQNKPTSPSELPELLQIMRSERNKNRKLNVPTTEGVLWIPMQDIVRLEAMRSYCSIYSTNGKRIVAAYPLSDFEKQLDSVDFMRVHKSHVVNVNQIQEYIRGDGGSLVLKDGSTVSVSRTAKAALLERLAMSL